MQSVQASTKTQSMLLKMCCSSQHTLRLWIKSTQGGMRCLAWSFTLTPMEAKKGFLDTTNALIRWMLHRLDLCKDAPLFNPFTGLHLEKGDYRIKQPWLFIEKIASGQCGTLQHPLQKKTWQEVVHHVIIQQQWQDADSGGLGDDWGWMEEQAEAHGAALDEL